MEGTVNPNHWSRETPVASIKDQVTNIAVAASPKKKG